MRTTADLSARADRRAGERAATGGSRPAAPHGAGRRPDQLGEARAGSLAGRRAVLKALGLTATGALLAACGARPTGPSTASSQPGVSAPARVGGPGGQALFIGTYTSGDGAGKGVSVGTWDSTSGQLVVSGVVPVANPSFLAVDPGHRVLYAVDEQDQGGVTALAIVPEGGLRMINTESSRGAGPTHLCVHPGGRYVLAANYDSGSVVVLPVRPDGGLGPATDLVQHAGSGPNADRQDGPHAHQVLADPTATYLHAVDLGTDTVYAYQLDLGTGKLAERHQVRTRPGSGPRHLAFHPSGASAYLVTELAGTVISYRYADGVLTSVQEQPTVGSVPPGARNQPAEVVVSPDGRFVYVSNRGTDSISVFAAGADGRLAARGVTPCGGRTPRHIGLDPTGTYLFSANQDSNTVTSFAVDRKTGGLSPVDSPLATPQPVCTLTL